MSDNTEFLADLGHTFRCMICDLMKLFFYKYGREPTSIHLTRGMEQALCFYLRRENLLSITQTFNEYTYPKLLGMDVKWGAAEFALE